MAEVHLQHSPTRCPYCHDGIDPTEFRDTRVCADCLARHHTDCWEGHCASCASTRVFLEPAASAEGVAATERARHLFNRLGIGLTAAYWTLMVAGTVAAVATGGLHVDPGQGGIGLPWTMWPGLVAAFALAIVLIPIPFLNVQDALRRRAHDPSCGNKALIAAAIPWLTAGVSAVIYHRVWGRHPLPGEPGRPDVLAPEPDAHQNEASAPPGKLKT